MLEFAAVLDKELLYFPSIKLYFVINTCMEMRTSLHIDK